MNYGTRVRIIENKLSTVVRLRPAYVHITDKIIKIVIKRDIVEWIAEGLKENGNFLSTYFALISEPFWQKVKSCSHYFFLTHS